MYPVLLKGENFKFRSFQKIEKNSDRFNSKMIVNFDI